MNVTERWADPKVWRLSEIWAIRNRMGVGTRCDQHSNGAGIQWLRIIAPDGRVRSWKRVDPRHGGSRAGWVEEDA